MEYLLQGNSCGIFLTELYRTFQNYIFQTELQKCNVTSRTALGPMLNWTSQSLPILQTKSTSTRSTWSTQRLERTNAKCHAQIHPARLLKESQRLFRTKCHVYTCIVLRTVPSSGHVFGRCGKSQMNVSFGKAKHQGQVNKKGSEFSRNQ